MQPPGATNEWHTLDKDFAPLHEEFRFTLDAFASDELHKLPRYWTERENALARPWMGERVFANPPYGRGLLARCVAKMAREADRAELIVALVPAWTERAWWQDHVEPGRRAGLLEVRFPRGRLRFGWPGRPDGHPRCVAGFPSALIVWRRP
ncbi:phage N-6-adenine-methyltransferase [Hyalangium gracile]|uniref:phage N-6-adenine-methyltransferase n=1 Tax=Hyalangium gracile TaxID=394092 RepID=UPI001CCE24DC